MKEKKIKKLINTLIPKPEGPFSLDELSNITGAEIFNHDNTYIKNINNVFDASEGDITFVDNPKYVNEINKTKASAIIVSYFNKKKANTLKPLLLLKNPYLGYSKIANYFYPNRLLSKVSNTKKNIIAHKNFKIRTIHKNLGLIFAQLGLLEKLLLGNQEHKILPEPEFSNRLVRYWNNIMSSSSQYSLKLLGFYINSRFIKLSNRTYKTHILFFLDVIYKYT